MRPEAVQAAQPIDLPPDTAPGGVEGGDRRTKVGSFLRKTSIDELPQLINVLRGEMSLIGPRPERPEFVGRFEESIYRYGDRQRVSRASPAGRRCTASAARRRSRTGSSGTTTTSRTGRSGST